MSEGGWEELTDCVGGWKERQSSSEKVDENMKDLVNIWMNEKRNGDQKVNKAGKIWQNVEKNGINEKKRMNENEEKIILKNEIFMKKNKN